MKDDHKMTLDEFEQQYAEHSGVTVEWLHAHGRHGTPCDCAEPFCKGWQMKHAEPEPKRKVNAGGTRMTQNLLTNGDFELDWGVSKNHQCLIFPVDGESYEMDVGNIFTPSGGWMTWFRHDAGTWDQPEVRDAWAMHDSRRVHSGLKGTLLFTFYRKHDAGFLQQVQAEPGTRLRLTAWAHAWSNHGLEGHEDCQDDGLCSCGVGRDVVAIPAGEIPPLNGDPWNDAVGNFLFSVGVDPIGGTDPYAATVIWGEPYAIYNGYARQLSVEAVAQASTVTVFLRSITLWGFKHNDAYWDDAELVVVGEEPPEPPPYECTVLVLPQTATLEQLHEVFALAFPDRRTFMFSHDDAGRLGGTAVLYNIPDEERQAYLGFYAERYPAVAVEFAYTSDWEDPPSELLLWQCNPLWGSEKIASPACSMTLCQTGCWVSACAMAQRFFGIKINATPSTANQALGATGGFTGCLTTWDGMERALGLEVFERHYDDQRARDWLDGGNVCFAEVEPESYMHFVLVTRYSEGRFWMHDPYKNVEGWLDEYYPGAESWRSICPFEEVPPPAHSKLGPHVLRTAGKLAEYIRSGVAVAKFVGDWGTARDVPAGALVIGRKHQDYDAQGQRAAGKTPLEAAQQFVQDQLPTYQTNPHIKYWEGHNEPVWNDEEGMRWYAQFEVERMQLMANLGLKCVIGNFAAGTPPLHLWPAFLPGLRATKQYEAILGLHEYSCPWMWWMTGEHQLDPNADEGDEGWTTLRYRKVYRQYLIPNGLGDVPLVITECGIDPLVNPKPPGCDGGTWKQLGDYWEEHNNEPDKADYYFRQLVWYDEELQKDDYVVGATIFCWGNFGLPWADFDVAQTPVEDNLIGYARAHPARPFEYPDDDVPPLPSFTLRGVHDEVGGQWLASNNLPGWCTIAGYIGTSPRDFHLPDNDVRYILRLSYSYATDDGGEGTMPSPDKLADHEAAVVETMNLNPNAWGSVYGNEPNNKREWPEGYSLSPEYYLASYNRVWARKPAGAKLSPCAIDPYNPGWGDWRVTWGQVLNQITGCDFLALHAYTHGPDPGLIWHRKEFDHAPLIGVYYDMRVLESQQDIIPARFAGLPQIVTETNHYVRLDGTVGWEPDAGQWVGETYRYFGQHGVAGACLFRHGYERWRYGDLPNILNVLEGIA